MTTKKCSKCCLEKDVSEFYKSIIGKNGKQLYKSGCIACRKRPERVWQPKPPKEKKKRVDTRVNRVQSPEINQKKSKKYYEKNRQTILEKQREKTRLKNLFKFSIVEKQEEIPVECL
jgi:hypothetical protein